VETTFVSFVTHSGVGPAAQRGTELTLPLRPWGREGRSSPRWPLLDRRCPSPGIACVVNFVLSQCDEEKSVDKPRSLVVSIFGARAGKLGANSPDWIWVGGEVPRTSAAAQLCLRPNLFRSCIKIQHRLERICWKVVFLDDGCVELNESRMSCGPPMSF